MSRPWTKEQRHCLEARGGTVLVSAAAGSGKTSVLVERVIRLITDDTHPVDADRLLVVTFTKAAAAEMKQRLSSALSEKMAADPHDRRLQRQQMLFPRAHISTVHSFCSALLRENFHLLGISPQFKVAEDTDVRLLRQDALTEVLEQAYAEKDPAFLDLVSLLTNGKDDRGLYEAVLRVYDFIQSHPFPEDWLCQQESLYEAEDPVEDTPWGGIMRQYVSRTLRHLTAVLNKLQQMAMSEEIMAEAYGDAFRADHRMMAEVAAAFDEADWDDAIALLRGIAFQGVKALRNYPYPAFKDQVKDLRDSVKKQVESLQKTFCLSRQDCREDMAAIRPIVQALCGLVRDFGRVFEEKKAARHLVDFNDLEHLTLRLLLTRREDGGMERTKLAEELSAFYEEVLVDEYQDTNAAQDALFSAISRNEQNLFMVGDVKQSIYGFRQAMPDIFITRQKAYDEYDGAHFPAAITLGHNFRSRKTVADSVNFVFSQLMSEEMGGLTYDQHHALIPAATYPEGDGFETAFYMIDDTAREDTDTKDAAEARLIAARIREWKETMAITDKGVSRPAKYGDFCILLRSKSSHAAVYVNELMRQGIPAWTATSDGFFSAPEVAAALSLLRLIDNPTQDIPLLAVMLSPIGGFIPDDLAIIRTGRLRVPLYVAVRDYARIHAGEALAERCGAFLAQMEGYRRLAATLPADQLIHRLLEETGLAAGYSARSHSEQRTANLRLLHEYARRFEQGRFRGLSAFIRYIDRLEEQNMDLSPASTLSEQADVVRIISIHHSKGLEFPVVFLAGLGHQFNAESTKGNLLLHASQGIGMMRRDPATRRQCNTLPRMAVAQSIRHAERAEELRVLYVAMTRAKEKLCLVMTAKNPMTQLRKAASAIVEAPTLPAQSLLAANCMGEWLMMAALRHPSGGDLRKMLEEESLSVIDTDSPWHIEVCTSPPAEDVTLSTEEVPADPALVASLQERLAYQYPYAALTQVPSKLAASALSHQAMAAEHIAEQRPAFWEKQPLSAAQRGTAMHTFMEHADFLRARENTAREADRLLMAGALSQDQRDSLNLPRLSRFFTSDLCERMLRSPRWLREQHFAIALPPDFFGYASAEDTAEDRVIVQGIADSVFLENGTWIIVDYKTDSVATDQELIDRYREQLRIYKEALQQTLSHPVAECWLYSFSLDRGIKCEV